MLKHVTFFACLNTYKVKAQMKCARQAAADIHMAKKVGDSNGLNGSVKQTECLYIDDIAAHRLRQN